MAKSRGDDIVSDAHAQLTHAASIDAPPQDVWPWLLQMGCQRAGWYSWDALDNAGVRSAERIIPELQHLAVGDVLPARPGGAGGFKVLRIVPERALVLDGASPQWARNVGVRAAAARLEQDAARHPLPCGVPAEHADVDLAAVLAAVHPVHGVQAASDDQASRGAHARRSVMDLGHRDASPNERG